MEVNYDKSGKIVEIWLTNADKSDDSVMQHVNEIRAKYNKKGAFWVVFYSGKEDLEEGTLGLLAYNKKLKAEQEVMKAKNC